MNTSKNKKIISVKSITVKENLPLPFVHYPSLYGTFIAFSKNEKEVPSLCLCSYKAVENYFLLTKNKTIEQNSNPLRMARLDSKYFPDILSILSITDYFEGIKSINFESKICHRCNMAVPSLRYCHEMYGTEFVQNFGWYINQAYLKLGIGNRFEYINTICPDELKPLISEYKEIAAKYSVVTNKMKEIQGQKVEETISVGNEYTYENYYKNIWEELDKQKEIGKILHQKSRAITKYVENMVREEFGVKKVGEAWVGETILKKIIEKIFYEKKILIHYRPTWLKGLELDIFIEDEKIAFEYQGQQHFFPIKVWGGEKAFLKLKERDSIKKEICEKLKIRLIYINYYDPLTEDFVRSKC